MYIPPTAQNLISLALAVIWFAGGIILYLRTRAKRVIYLRHFPPVNGVPLDIVMSANPFGAEARAIYRAMWRRQADAELEGLRREIWRRYRYVALWIYGFPVVAVGVAALLITTGAIRVMAK